MNYRNASKILKEYNKKYSHLLNEGSKIDYDRYEKTIGGLINTSFSVDSENFDRFEVDIYPTSYGDQISIYAVFKKPFNGNESDMAEDLRYDIISFVKTFFPKLKGTQFGFGKTIDKVYRETHKPHYDSLKNNKQITEELKNFNNSFLLTEASKIKILTDKLGFTNDIATRLDSLCGPLSVWMANKLIDYILSYNPDGIDGKKGAVSLINARGIGSVNSGHITSIMDYIRVGLNGNTSEVKNLDFNSLIQKSKEWHDSLKVSGGEINYKEPHTHDILVDKRDENGFGFYWVDLNTNSSDEECRRMGHCGRTGNRNTILSLRENKIYPGNPKYTINISHLTAAVGNDGIMYQLKGPKNSKPKEEYNDLILPLFYVLGGGGEEEDYLIQGFGSEYAAERDFKLTDLPDNVITTLYKDRPDLFKSYSLRKKVRQLGLVEVPEIDYVIEYEVGADDVDRIVDGDWTVSQRKKKTPAGGEYTIKIGMFETILSGDMWDLWDNWDADWKSALQYYVDKENEQKILDLLKGMAGEEFDEELDLEDAIKKYDNDNEIRSAITSSVNDAEASDYENYLWKNLKDALEEWGTIIKMDDTGVRLRIDTEQYIQDYIDYHGDEAFEDAFERCDEDVSCVFAEILSDLDKPKFSIDERWYPDINDGEFNEILFDRLLEIKP